MSVIYTIETQKTNPDAKPFYEMTINELSGITGNARLLPGQSAVVDPIAVSIAAKNGINIAVLDMAEK